jgi:hypothetical protein
MLEGHRRWVGLAVAIGALALLGLAGFVWRSESASSEPGSSAAESVAVAAEHVTVPDVEGTPVAEAIHTLAQAGLVAVLNQAADAPRSGAVEAMEPAPGSSAAEGSLVRLEVGAPPRRSVPAGTPEQEPLGRAVEECPVECLGLYRADDGTPVVVLAPGVDEQKWRERLAAAAAGRAFRIEIGTRSARELEAVQKRLSRRDWSPHAREIGFVTFVDPASSTVRVESDQLSPGDLAALAERFGTAVSIDTSPGSHPVRASRDR